MIRVIRGKEVRPAVFDYGGTVAGVDFRGVSRQPLLDACRQIKSILKGTDTAKRRVGVFRVGRREADVSCALDWGAAHTIVESYKDGMRILKYHPFEITLT
jgi:hypothetical protein